MLELLFNNFLVFISYALLRTTNLPLLYERIINKHRNGIRVFKEIEYVLDVPIVFLEFIGIRDKNNKN